MDFIPIDLKASAPIQYLCCEKCRKVYTNNTVVHTPRCPKCGLVLWIGRDKEDVEQYLKLVEERRKL